MYFNTSTYLFLRTPTYLHVMYCTLPQNLSPRRRPVCTVLLASIEYVGVSYTVLLHTLQTVSLSVQYCTYIGVSYGTSYLTFTYLTLHYGGCACNVSFGIYFATDLFMVYGQDRYIFLLDRPHGSCLDNLTFLFLSASQVFIIL